MTAYLEPPEQYDNPDADMIARGQMIVAAGGKAVMDGTVLRIYHLDPNPPTLAEAIAARLGDLAAVRYEASLWTTWTIGGATYQAPCGTDAKANVNGEIQGAQLANDTGPRLWKVAPGVNVELQFSDLVALGQTMRAHVQACFDHEGALAAQIMALTDASAVAAFDIGSGWPA